MEWSCSWQHMSMASRDFMQIKLSCARPTQTMTERGMSHLMYQQAPSPTAEHAQTQTSVLYH